MLFVFLAVLAGVAILKAAGDAASDAAKYHSRQSVGDIIWGLNNSSLNFALDSKALNQAAETMAASGYGITAEAIRDKADIAKAIESIPPELPSPFPGVSNETWGKFVDLFRGNDKAEVSPSFQFGLFNIGYRRLADLGLASGVRRGDYKGRSVWFGRFNLPLTLERFLSDPALQYKVFCKDIADRNRLIKTQHQDVIGTIIEGEKVSLSGLLTVAKLAGTAGLTGWISDPSERQKFSQTTAAFKRANGIF